MDTHVPLMARPHVGLILRRLGSKPLSGQWFLLAFTSLAMQMSQHQPYPGTRFICLALTGTTSNTKPLQVCYRPLLNS